MSLPHQKVSMEQSAISASLGDLPSGTLPFHKALNFSEFLEHDAFCKTDSSDR